MKNWDNVVLVPEFDEQGVACYRLEGGDYENEYYVISEAESRKLTTALFLRLLRCFII